MTVDFTKTAINFAAINLPPAINRLHFTNKGSSLVQRSQREELANAATHGAGFLLALAGAAWMIVTFSNQTAPAKPVFFGCLVYLFSLIGLYLMSTLSHCFPREPNHSRFRKLDQAFIYLLILGTYTPFAVKFLKSSVALAVFAVLWCVAIAAATAKVGWAHRVEKVSVWLYVFLGWLPAMIGLPALTTQHLECFYWMACGGVLYTLGIVVLFFDSKHWLLHAVWHCFVIAASTVHFMAVMRFVVE